MRICSRDWGLLQCESRGVLSQRRKLTRRPLLLRLLLLLLLLLCLLRREIGQRSEWVVWLLLCESASVCSDVGIADGSAHGQRQEHG